MRPREGDPVIIFQDNQVFLTQDHTYPLYGKEITEGEGEGSYQFLFSIDGQKYFLALEPSAAGRAGLEAYPVRHLRDLRPMHLALRAIRPGICTPGTRITGSAEDAGPEWNPERMRESWYALPAIIRYIPGSTPALSWRFMMGTGC